MNEGYDFHPQAAIDLEDIGEVIAHDSPMAANRVIAELLDTIESLVPFPQRATVALT
jgi:plasmid stabilization system protein ParE